jgi:MFS transporter, PAT family, beta-lactamase induction signal transducer AmpG
MTTTPDARFRASAVSKTLSQLAARVRAGSRAWLEALATYTRPRVLIVLALGFSGGLPLALSGTTLLYWMREVGVDLKTVGLFALVGTPYVFKFLWAPLVDALDVPVLSRRFGRRRGWLILSQLILIVTVVVLGLCDPVTAPFLVAASALLVATASATQDIIIDAFRVESLPESEQAAGMASYVAGYRIGMLASGAGILFVVSGFEQAGLSQGPAWGAAYAIMAALVVVGVVVTLCATEPERSAQAEADHARHASESAWLRVIKEAIAALIDFFSLDLALWALVFVVLFKVTDALSGVMTGPFSIDAGFSRDQYATIVKGVGLVATLIGGFAGGAVARRWSLAAGLWIGGILQSVANFGFCWVSVTGTDTTALTIAIVVENFTSAIGTVVFVAYLSELCRNPLHTATQYALLTALAAVGRTMISSYAGGIVAVTGWTWFFVICAAAGIPALVLLGYLQRQGHFAELEKPATENPT